MTINSKEWKWIGIAAAILLAAFFLLQRSCRSSQIDNLKGQLAQIKIDQKAEKDAHKVADEAAAKTIAEQAKKLAAQDKIIAASTGAEGKIDAAIAAKNKATADLEAERKNLTDKDAIIKNQDATIAALHISLSLEQAGRAEDQKQRDAWHGKFDAQVIIDKNKDVINAGLKADYDREVQRRTIAEALAAKEGKQITSLKIGGGIKTAVVIGLAAFGVYELFIKKTPAAPAAKAGTEKRGTGLSLSFSLSI